MKKTIALIAHDGKKADMVAFIKDRTEMFQDMYLIATGTTATYVRQAGLEVEAKLSGPLGGDAQIAAMVAEKKLDGVIFFRDPLGKHPHEPDVLMLLRLCDLHNIPLATNPASAHYLISGIKKVD
ncbi:MAG: methylglyoxal synthase [Cytophagaceae bacterium]